MMTVLGTMAFGGAAATAGYAIWASIVPHIDRVAGALRGDIAVPFTPLATLAHAERRIAVRRWAAASAPRANRRAAA